MDEFQDRFEANQRRFDAYQERLGKSHERFHDMLLEMLGNLNAALETQNRVVTTSIAQLSNQVASLSKPAPRAIN